VTIVQYTFTHKQYKERQKQAIHRTTKIFGRVRAVPRPCDLYPGITTEEKARKNLSQCSRRVPAASTLAGIVGSNPAGGMDVCLS
jgi:hypothetical protein